LFRREKKNKGEERRSNGCQHALRLKTRPRRYIPILADNHQPDIKKGGKKRGMGD